MVQRAGMGWLDWGRLGATRARQGVECIGHWAATLKSTLGGVYKRLAESIQPVKVTVQTMPKRKTNAGGRMLTSQKSRASGPLGLPSVPLRRSVNVMRDVKCNEMRDVKCVMRASHFFPHSNFRMPLQCRERRSAWLELPPVATASSPMSMKGDRATRAAVGAMRAALTHIDNTTDELPES